MSPHTVQSGSPETAQADVGTGRLDVHDPGQRQALLDEYRLADLLEVDGKVPLNYFTFRPTFGDLLSPWLVQQMTGRDVAVADRARPHYIVIGSVISQGTDQSVVWGAGTYGTEAKREVPTGARFQAVRGPLTQSKLSASKGFGLEVPEVYGDPALLLPFYYCPDVPITHEYGVAVGWSERAWAKATYGEGVKLIDFARGDVEAVIRELLSCRRIVTSALHGLIVADAYGIPSAWLASDSPRGGVFTFYDYFASVDKFRRPHKFDPSLEAVTAARLKDEFIFSEGPIDFDYRALLDASPFLIRADAKEHYGRSALQGRESGSRLRDQPGRHTLLPSLGYFGGIAANFLSVRFTAGVSQISLYLPDDPGELDLRGLELFRNGRRLTVDDAIVSISQSSDARSPRNRRSPFAYGGIRTERESGPWWTATFNPPVNADEVRIYNRRDGWGVRSQALTIAVSGSEGEKQVVQSVDSDRVIEETLTLLQRLTGIAIKSSMLASAESAGMIRREVLAELARRAREGVLTSDREEQRLLGSVLRRQTGPSNQSLTGDEWALLGHLLAAERLRLPSTGTSMLSYRGVLDSRAKLKRLEDEVNLAGAVLGTPRAVLTRHGFTDVGVLRKRSDEYVGLLQRASAALEECGHPAMLAYGTLLGAVREGNFLAHDDDIDMLIPTHASNREEVEIVLDTLADQLRSKGWRVSRPNSYTNFHLTEPKTKLHIDVFPLLVNGDRTSLHMEKMRLREIPTKILLPPSRFNFLGEEMLAPADPEAFLAERYGDGWATPDPFYDWPWELRD